MSDRTTEAASEIGCPHDFGATVECPFCGAPRSTTTSEWVTRHYNEEHPNDPNAGYSWPPKHDAPLASQPEPAVTEALRHVVHWVDAGRDEPPENGYWACACGTNFALDGVDEFAKHLATVPAPSLASAEKPSTETGQQLLAHHGDGTWFTLGRDDLRRAILIIEAEAGILGWNRRAASDREIAEASEQEGEDA